MCVYVCKYWQIIYKGKMSTQTGNGQPAHTCLNTQDLVRAPLCVGNGFCFVSRAYAPLKALVSYYSRPCIATHSLVIIP